MIFSRFFLFKGNVNVISKNLPNSLHWYLDLQWKRKKIVFILFCKDFSLSVLYKSANPQEDLRISLISPRYPVVTILFMNIKIIFIVKLFSSVNFVFSNPSKFLPYICLHLHFFMSGHNLQYGFKFK